MQYEKNNVFPLGIREKSTIYLICLLPSSERVCDTQTHKSALFDVRVGTYTYNNKTQQKNSAKDKTNKQKTLFLDLHKVCKL